jgi:hypothetical protein
LINKTDRSLANLTRKRKKTQINKIRDEKGCITNANEIQRITREYFENLCSNKLENLEEMDKCIDAFDRPQLNQEDINNLTYL